MYTYIITWIFWFHYFFIFCEYLHFWILNAAVVIDKEQLCIFAEICDDIFCRKFSPFIELVYQMHTYLHKLPQRWTIIYQCNLEKTMRTTELGLRRWCIPFHSQCVVMPSKGEREISVLVHFFFHFITVHMLLRFKKNISQ